MRPSVQQALAVRAWLATPVETRGPHPLSDLRARGEAPRVTDRRLVRDTDERLKEALRVAR